MNARRVVVGLVVGAMMLGLFAFGIASSIFGNMSNGLAALEDESDCAPDSSLTLPAADDGSKGVDTAARAALRAGWSGQDAVTAVAVAGAESTYDPRAANSSSTARGLWQVMLSYHQPKFRGADWRDPYANARVAHQIWQDGGWQPWVAYTSGAYRKYLPEAQRAVDQARQGDTTAAATTVAAAATSQPQAGLQPAAQKGYDAVRDQFGFKGTIGGFADRNVAGTGTKSKHALGLAIDVMTSDTKVGDPIANYFAGPGYDAYGVENVIWRGRIFNKARGWHPYTHPGGGRSATLLHYDHVHVDFRSTGGTGAAPAIYTGEEQCVDTTVAAAGTVVYPVTNYASDSKNFGGSGAMWSAKHSGTDFSLPCGTPVLAAHGGTVQIETGYGWAGPQMVKISTGPQTLTTWYAHMQRVDVKPGQTVQPGQTIGAVGSEGNSTGCHLHFEVHPKNGSIYADDVDPSKWLAANVGKNLGGPDVKTVSQSTGNGQATILTANIRYSVPTAAAREHLATLMGSGADVIMLQEVGRRDIPGMAASISGRWQVWQPAQGGRGANTILWNASKLRAVDRGIEEQFRWAKYDRFTPWVVLTDRGGSSFAAVGLHMMVGATKSAQRQRLYSTGMGNVRGTMAAMKRAGIPVVAGGDWNYQLQRPGASWGPVVALRGDGLTTNWQQGSPCQGSTIRGGRIDGFAYDPQQVQMTAQGCLSNGPSDHRPVWMAARY